jgi:hypothetical protein
MGTSCSNDAGSSDAGWTAGASLFSGRPDPVWPLDVAAAERLLDIWRGLARSDDVTGSDASTLAYRGSYLSNGRGERWIVGDARARHEVASMTKDARADDDRHFERAILATAPPGTIPAGLIDALTSGPAH